MELFADRDDVAPTPGLVASVEVWRCRPAVDGVRERRRDAEALLLDGREELRLPDELVLPAIEWTVTRVRG